MNYIECSARLLRDGQYGEEETDGTPTRLLIPASAIESVELETLDYPKRLKEPPEQALFVAITTVSGRRWAVVSESAVATFARLVEVISSGAPPVLAERLVQDGAAPPNPAVVSIPRDAIAATDSAAPPVTLQVAQAANALGLRGRRFLSMTYVRDPINVVWHLYHEQEEK